MNTRTIIFAKFTIRQKDSLTHTKFIILGEESPFPRDNFDLALSWTRAGLLAPYTTALLEHLATAFPSDPETTEGVPT